MIRAALVLLVLLAPWTGTASAQSFAERKVALVVGNGRYETASILANPANDATAMADALRRIGFSTVEVQQDLGAAAMRLALQRFAAVARGANTALVFYAGHGLQVAEQTYLVPTDARLATDADVPFEAVPLDLVLQTVEGARSLRIVILDACRNNPFKPRMVMTSPKRSVGRGLGYIEPGDTLVAYAAKHGQEALDGDAGSGNSPFTAALLRHIETPGLDVELLFRHVRDDVLASTNGRQEPFKYGSLSAQAHYLVAPGSDTVSAPDSVADAKRIGQAWRVVNAARGKGCVEYGQSKAVEFLGRQGILPRADLTSLCLQDVDLSRSILSLSDFSDSRLVNVNFSGAFMEHASFNSSILVNVDFSDSNLMNASFLRADIHHPNFTGSVITDVIAPSGCYITDYKCNFGAK